MPNTIINLNQSSLQDYHDCARRFELRYLQRLAYPAVEVEPALENEKRQREGEAFHRMAQQYFIGIPAQRVESLAVTENLQRWWEHFSSDKTIQDLQRSKQLLAESTLSAPLGGFRLIAKYDLIAIGEGKVTIYDWKTYRKRPKNDWMLIRWQTRVYRALLMKAGAHLNNGNPFAPQSIEMVYWYADFPSEPARFTYTEGQYKRDWDDLEKIAEEIARANTFPLTDKLARCGYCPYRSYCARGISANEAEEAELESAAEEFFDIQFEQIGEIAF